MNIFVLDIEPKKAAQYHNDKHVVKMILETAQILSTVVHKKNFVLENIYKKTHQNHPSVLWAEESKANFIWLCKLGFELGNEYRFRYNKTHKSIEVIKKIFKNKDQILFNNQEMTNFKLAMPDECKVQIKEKTAFENSILSYRNYYIKEKNSIANWKNRNRPDWYIERNN